MNIEERNSFRKEMLGKLEEQWAKNNRPEDALFYYHPSEDKIVLSNATSKHVRLPIHLDARKLAAITIVAGGYGGDMPEDQAYDLLDDIDFYYNKVKCRKIEKLLPVLNKLVIQEQKFL